MHFLKSIWLCLSAALLFAAPVPVSAQTDISPPNGPWTHAATGVSFPIAVGEFRRARIVEFRDDNNSIGYSYRDGTGDLTLTFYVYPSTPYVTCEAEFADVKAAISKYAGLTMISDGAVLAPNGSASQSAFWARYNIPAGAMRPDMPEMISDAYLYCSPDNNWLVKYRASWSGSEGTFPDIGAFMRSISWPIALTGEN